MSKKTNAEYIKTLEDFLANYGEGLMSFTEINYNNNNFKSIFHKILFKLYRKKYCEDVVFVDLDQEIKNELGQRKVKSLETYIFSPNFTILGQRPITYVSMLSKKGVIILMKALERTIKKKQYSGEYLEYEEGVKNALKELFHET